MMPATKRGRKRATVRNISQRPGGSNPATAARKPTPLPIQYDFTPAVTPAVPIPVPQSREEPIGVLLQQPMSTTPHFWDYPPPQSLFQNSGNHATLSSPEVQNNQVNPRSKAPASLVHNAQTHSYRSSQGNNFENDSDPVLPKLQEDTVRALNALLMVPSRDKFTTVLSPNPIPNTTWFTRDKKSRLVRKITKVFTNKFDSEYYSWSCVPQERKERYFIEFVKTHTWDPLITGEVQRHFREICQRRMKDMVSNVRTSRERPRWIKDTLWKKMVAYWDTEEAQERSSIYSNARMSDRDGMGPHIHLSGPTSYQQMQEEMEEAFGRPVSLGEVFIKTHTKPDGTYVDRKAEKITANYEKNVQDKLAELAANSALSDGASPPPDLTADDYTAIFLQSTEKDSRGNLYGVGSLKENLENLVTGKRKRDSSSFVALEEQLNEAQRKIEEQASYNTRRDAEIAAREEEHSRAVAEQKDKLEHLSLVEKYLRQTDPGFLDFMATHSAEATTHPSAS